VNWQEIEFYTHVDVDIIPLNGSETTASWQETEFYAHVDVDIIFQDAELWTVCTPVSVNVFITLATQ
jgi:hypothetical protein